MDRRKTALIKTLIMDRQLPIAVADIDAALAAIDDLAVKQGDERAWSLRTDDAAITYMCGINWQHDLLSGSRGVDVFPSEAAIRKNKGCIEECGIVEVEMRIRRWVQPQNLRGDK
jgi:hypothetical protein